MYRNRDERLEVLLVHLGGPYWQRKDSGAWTIPRGQVEAEEDYLAAAIREFTEETGWHPHGPYLPLGAVHPRSGRTVHAWAFEGSNDPASIRSNLFEIEWPPKSGQRQQFPEIDRADFFTIAEAQNKIITSELVFLHRLAEQLAKPPRE